MKKLLLVILLSYGVNLDAQIAFSDAMKIKKASGRMRFDNEKKTYCLPQNNNVFKILKYYVPTADSGTTDGIIKNFEENPFVAFCEESLSSEATPFGVKSFFSSIGGLDVTNIANGVAQFMIERAKQELTVAFFDRFKKFSDQNPEFRVLFPKTADNLQNLLAYKYPEMLPALRTGFFDDLKSITYHLDDVLELPRYHELLKNFPEIRVAIRSIRIIHEIESGDSHPADVLKKFAEFPEWTDTISSKGFRNFGSSVKLAALFSNSLRNDTTISHDTTRAWITFKQLDTLVRNDTLFKIYLGLIYQLARNNDIKFLLKNETKSFAGIMTEQKDNLFLFQNKVTEFIELANIIDKKLDTLKDKKARSIALTNDDYYDYIDVSLDVIDYAFSIGKLFNKDIEVEQYTMVARKSNDLYRNIYKKEYTQALTNGIDILSSIHDMINESKNELLTSINTITEKDFGKASLSLKAKVTTDRIDASEIAKIRTSLDSSNIPGSKKDTLANKVIALVNSKDYFNKLIDILEKITRYGLFMANVVEAETPAEVSSVLENAVLPVGSSSIKKNSAFNISIQSYLGGYKRFGSFTETNSTWSNEWGVIAPIGVSFSHGLKKGGAFSLFASLFDIGAIVDYQLKKDPDASTSNPTDSVVSKDYEVKLGQIFSPGGYLVYGFPFNIPLSFGIGGQYGPGLGKVEAQTTIVNNPQWRWSVFLAVDIPFFNLVNSPKKHKP